MTQTTPAPTARLSADSIEYIGKVSEWLRTAPSGSKSYGTFYIDLVRLSFDGAEIVGSFEPDEWGGDTYEFHVGLAQS